VQATLKNLLNLVNSDINLVYFLFDGAFGNNDALQMVRQCELHLISKMRYDSALYLPYVGKYSGRGPLRSYEKKLNCRALPKKYLKSASIDGKIRTCIYQVNVWHKLFADMLNVVIVVKTNLKTGQTAHVILFSSDLGLAYDKLIEYYQLCFQIEFNFRDAKQFWGLEDFMNIKQNQVHNAANLSMFMVSLSQALLQKKSGKLGQSINDLKAWFRASKYVEKTLKLLGQNPEPIFIENVIIQASEMGRVNPLNSPVST
jgi:putative transposase